MFFMAWEVTTLFHSLFQHQRRGKGEGCLKWFDSLNDFSNMIQNDVAIGSIGCLVTVFFSKKLCFRSFSG